MPWLLAPIAAAIAWSRVALDDHTTGQVTISAIAGGGAYALLL